MEVNKDTPAATTPDQQVNTVARNKHTALRTFLLCVFAGLVALAVSVIWLLPDYVDPVESIPAEEVAPAQSAPDAPTQTQTQQARHKREAEKALQAYLKKQAILEAQDVTKWAGNEYETVLQGLARADAAFANSSFEVATQEYNAASDMLDAIEQSRPERLAEALSKGQQALDQFAGDEAMAQYNIALAIDPSEQRAVSGLERARNIEQVADLIARARAAEAELDWEAARGLYQEAIALDAAVPEARSGLDNVISAIEAERFRDLMSRALSAVENAQFDSARQWLTEAAALRPQSSEVTDARRQLELAFQEQQIGTHRNKAETLAAQERWHEAVREFDAVLGIDPQAQFAVVGVEHARRLARLNDQIDTYLKHPERLHSPQPKTNARSLLDVADLETDTGPLLQQKFDTLRNLLARAETPVSIQLVSDGLTEVIINRVARLGAFEETTIELLPGNYVARGQRVGYRDVRIEFTVGIPNQTPVVTIRCEEKI